MYSFKRNIYILGLLVVLFTIGLLEVVEGEKAVFFDYDERVYNGLQHPGDTTPCVYKYRNKIGRDALMKKGSKYPMQFAIFGAGEKEILKEIESFYEKDHIMKMYEDIHLNGGESYNVVSRKSTDAGYGQTEILAIRTKVKMHTGGTYCKRI
ncbi:hypothetical protein PPL_02716 [Heterostelium album PN500]|uniref:Uncharacterized protein n=1 Tax=Heterostelium pallidum (strain ATCC 26659 / Pp 5 / PN500) TaxID=670386 RepID=D3B2V2_HETP5|nr:hypothetical protein PPL_02716 [Heterostelium album PN500]EFA83650.1 hypothetical protein PPL_02716 [Heterostelium album PN500]|eukprot:XP_020435767.1 hypothetical protein PPL_02716 [Heterostelium album PN500]